jgi:DNA-binding FrmR family transcriptional regulator
MQNKELAQRKIENISGKLKTIRVMITRQGVTVDDINKEITAIDEKLDDLMTLISRQDQVYGR